MVRFSTIFQPSEVSVEEGDIIYVCEDPNDSEFYTAKCGDKKGKVPKDFGIAKNFLSILHFSK